MLLLVDASFGFEMEIFEFLNICQVHGFPRVMGVLTHLDHFKDNKLLNTTKKRLKHRFWTEVYQVCDRYICATYDYCWRWCSWYAVFAMCVFAQCVVTFCFWYFVVSQGAKLFHLSGLVETEYQKTQIHNLCRFISVIKLRPLTWRSTHPHLLADRCAVTSCDIHSAILP